MGTLKVFDSQGRALYPHGAPDENQMQRYFDQDILAVGPQDGEYKIEAYLKVKTHERNEQVSIRYTSDRLDSLLEDCRTAIQTQLVDKRGWTIREPYGNGPEQLSWLVIWEGIAESRRNRTQEDLYTDTDFGLGLNREEGSLLESMVNEENDTVRITASDYEVIAEALVQYLLTGDTIVVSRERHSPPEYTDIHLSISADQWENFKLHDETQQTLQRLKEQKQEELRQEALDELASTLGSLQELNTNEYDVKQRLSTALSDTYTGLTVVENSTIRNLRQQARVRSEGTSQTVTQDRGPLARLKSRPMLVVVPVLLLLMLSLIGAVLFFGLPFLDDGESQGSAEFNIEDVDPPSNSNVTVGEEFNISVTVENSGTARGETNVSLSWNGSEDLMENESKSYEIDGGDNRTKDFSKNVSENGTYNYTIKIPDGDSENGTIGVVDGESNGNNSNSRIAPGLSKSVSLPQPDSATHNSLSEDICLVSCVQRASQNG